MTIEKIITILAATALLMMTTILGAVGYTLFFAPDPLEYVNLPFPTVQPSVRAGEVVPVIVERCNTRGKPITYSLTHSLMSVDTQARYVLPGLVLQDIFLPAGCGVVTSLINQIPAEVPSGRYKLVGSARVEGPIRDYVVPWHSQEFDVISDEPR